MKLPVCVDPRYPDAVIFDLDGVVTDTAAIHLAAWTEMLGIFLAQRPPAEGEDHALFTDDDYRHFIDGRPRCDGVAEFLQSRGISLPWGTQTDDGDTIYGLANREQRAFVDLLSKGVPVFNSTVELVRKLEAADVGTAVFSSSRNCDEILQAPELPTCFPFVSTASSPGSLGFSANPILPSCWKQRSGSKCDRIAVSSSTTPKPAWRRKMMAGCGSAPPPTRGIRDRVHQTRRRQVTESIAPHVSEQRTAASAGRSVERGLART